MDSSSHHFSHFDKLMLLDENKLRKMADNHFPHHEHGCNISCLCKSMFLVNWWWWKWRFVHYLLWLTFLRSAGAAGCRWARSWRPVLWHEVEVSARCHGWVRLLCVTGPLPSNAQHHHLLWQDGKWLFVFQMLSFAMRPIQWTNQQWQHFLLPPNQSKAHNSFLLPSIFSVEHLKYTVACWNWRYSMIVLWATS